MLQISWDLGGICGGFPSKILVKVKTTILQDLSTPFNSRKFQEIPSTLSSLVQMFHGLIITIQLLCFAEHFFIHHLEVAS